MAALPRLPRLRVRTPEGERTAVEVAAGGAQFCILWRRPGEVGPLRGFLFDSIRGFLRVRVSGVGVKVFGFDSRSILGFSFDSTTF